MTLHTSTFAAQDALLAALLAAPALAEWERQYGLPAGRPSERHIWIDEQVDNWEQAIRASGTPAARDETFRLTVYVYSRRTGATAAEVRAEVKGAADVVADLVGQAPFLGGAVLYAEITGGRYEGAFADAAGTQREGALRIDVSCTAFLVA